MWYERGRSLLLFNFNFGFLQKIIKLSLKCRWPLATIELNTISHLAYSYKSVLFGNDLQADQDCEIFAVLCSTCCLRHAPENAYCVLALSNLPKNHPTAKYKSKFFIKILS